MTKIPNELQPVLAKITHMNSLGIASWFEVVYHNGTAWCSYGSDTFSDGEKVEAWVYATSAIGRELLKK